MLNNLENINLRVTIKLTTYKILTALESNKSMIEQGIYRLKKKGFIELYKRKDGRSGWCQYKLSKAIDFQSGDSVNSINLKQSKNLPYIYNSSNTININKYKNQSDSHQPNDDDKDKIIADLQKQLELQKQQFNNQSQLTTPQSEKNRLTDHINKKLNDIETQVNTENSADTQDDSEAWTEIDFSALADYGFKKSHIKQIINANTSLTPQEVQDSIEHYAWALKNRREEMKGYAPVSNPLRGLMGVLKKGNAWVEGSYKSPEELALELQIKNKRMQLERQQAKKDELFNIEFEIWYTKLTSEDITKIEATNGFKSLPIATFNKKMSSSMYRGLMQGYFRDKIINKNQ